MKLAQTMTLSILVQLEYYLNAPLKEWPMRLFACLYSTREVRLHECEKFLHAPDCCCDEMSRKIRALFDDAPAMVADTSFWHAMKLTASRTRLTNMHIERMLNLCNRSVSHDGGAPFMERWSADGDLSQWLTEHAVRGRADPRAETAGTMER
eukprot:5914171-Pyramimonas_sp.AAC.1